MEDRVPTRRSLLALAVLVLTLGLTGPRLSGYVLDVHQSLTPLVHLYRGMAAAQAGEVHAAGAWLRKALSSETSGRAEEGSPPIRPQDLTR